MTCLQIEELFGLYIYDESTAKERALVETHLETCLDCKAKLKRFQEIGVHHSETLNDLPEIDWDRNWQMIQRQLPANVNPGARAESKTGSSRSTFRWAGALAASLAIFAVGYIIGLNNGVQKDLNQPEVTISKQGTAKAGPNPRFGRDYYVQEFQAHLENTKPVIIEYANYWKAAGTSEKSLPPVEKELILELLIQNQLLLCRIPSDNNRHMQQLLSELKTILTKIAAMTLNDPESISTIKQMIRKKGLLFKMETLQPIDEGEVSL